VEFSQYLSSLYALPMRRCHHERQSSTPSSNCFPDWGGAQDQTKIRGGVGPIGFIEILCSPFPFSRLLLAPPSCSGLPRHPGLRDGRGGRRGHSLGGRHGRHHGQEPSGAPSLGILATLDANCKPRIILQDLQFCMPFVIVRQFSHKIKFSILHSPLLLGAV